MKFAAMSLLMFVMTLVSAPQAEAAHYNNPTWNGYKLDWCKTFEQGCGQPAADLYCQKRGSPRSTSFQFQPQVHVQTMTIGNNAICNPAVHRCDSFASIDCQDTVKTFNGPTWNGYKLDWCKTFEGACGAPAAQMYCQKAGYPQLVNFQKQGSVQVQTMTIGNNAICNPSVHVCDSFQWVQCRK